MINDQKDNKKKRKFSTILLWSFIIHLIILLIFLIFAFRKSILSLATMKKFPQLQKKELPASLKPRKSEHGTTVVFDDTPQFKPPKSEVLVAQKQKLEKPQQEALGKDEITQKPQPEIKKQKVIAKAETKSDLPKIEDHKIKIAKLEKPKVQEAAKLDKETTTGAKELTKEAKDKLTKPIEEKEKLIAKVEPIPEEQKVQKIRTFGLSDKNASPITPPRKSIIAMTKGFVENLKDKGDDWIKRKGDDTKRPSFEELKYISYEQRLIWCWQNSCKINFLRNPNSPPKSGSAIIYFTINENGAVINTKIEASSGDKELDDLFIKSINVASPFPPIPKHFGKSTYTSGGKFKFL